MKWTANSIGDSGATAISESLKTNTTLTELDLWTMMKKKQDTVHWQGSVHAVILRQKCYSFPFISFIFIQSLYH